MKPEMKNVYAKCLKELISKMRSHEMGEPEEEKEESPRMKMGEAELAEDDTLEPEMEGYEKKKKKLAPTGVMAEDGHEVDDGEDAVAIEAAKKAFFKKPLSGPVKGKTRNVIARNMRPKDEKVPPTKRHSLI